MSSYFLAVAVLAALNVASIALIFLMWTRMQRLEATLSPRSPAPAPAAPSVAPAPASAPPPPKEETPDKFTSALMGGEMSLRLQQEMREPPEKYRFVSSLADQGMEAAEIAKALHLSQGEVEQILTLGRLGRRSDEGAAEPKDSDAADRKG